MINQRKYLVQKQADQKHLNHISIISVLRRLYNIALTVLNDAVLTFMALRNEVTADPPPKIQSN